MVKSLFKKIEKGVRKGRDKLKEGLGDLANVIGDKLVPRELAPFLPLLAFVPGLNVGLGSLLGLNPTLAQYLVPQLLTAASTGKTRGDIDLGAQAVTAAGSFLSDPNRFQFGTKVTGGDPVFTDPTIDPGYVTGGETVPMEFADITNPSFTDRLKLTIRKMRRLEICLIVRVRTPKKLWAGQSRKKLNRRKKYL